MLRKHCKIAQDSKKILGTELEMQHKAGRRKGPRRPSRVVGGDPWKTT